MKALNQSEEDDFLSSLGYLSLATRLKRISDRMVHSGRAMYKSLEWDIEPNWYMIFQLLKVHGSLTVTEIAQYLQFSHPSIVQIVHKMTQQGYLNSSRSKEDGRRQLLELTKKAQQKLPEFERIWEAGTQGLAQMMADLDFLPMLIELEKRLNHKDFMERTLTEYTSTSYEK